MSTLLPNSIASYVGTAIFLLTYVLIALGENSPRKLDRPTAALLGAVLMVISGTLSRKEAADALNMGTLSVLFGMMALVVALMRSGLPTYLGQKVLSRCRSPRTLMAAVVFVSGTAAAAMLNDTVCLLGTPLILRMTAQIGIPPVPFLFALTTSANIGSVMTLTGNPQNIIIGHLSPWSWPAFAIRMAPIGFLCLTVNWLLLVFLFRKKLASRSTPPDAFQQTGEEVDSSLAWRSGCTFFGLFIALVSGVPMDISTLTAATLLLVWVNRPPAEILDSIDWSLLLFFAGLFIVVAGFAKADSAMLSAAVVFLWKGFSFLNSLIFSAVALIGSNIFSNVPFVLIAGHWVSAMKHPKFMWLLLSLTSTFAGNFSLFGSVANLIVARARKNPLHFRLWDFSK